MSCYFCFDEVYIKVTSLLVFLMWGRHCVQHLKSRSEAAESLFFLKKKKNKFRHLSDLDCCGEL